MPVAISQESQAPGEIVRMQIVKAVRCTSGKHSRHEEYFTEPHAVRIFNMDLMRRRKGTRDGSPQDLVSSRGVDTHT